MYVQGVSRLVDITAGGDFLGLRDKKKKVHINPSRKLQEGKRRITADHS